MKILSGQGGRPTALLIRVLAGGNNLMSQRLRLLTPEIIFLFKLGQSLFGKTPGADQGNNGMSEKITRCRGYYRFKPVKLCPEFRSAAI